MTGSTWFDLVILAMHIYSVIHFIINPAHCVFLQSWGNHLGTPLPLFFSFLYLFFFSPLWDNSNWLNRFIDSSLFLHVVRLFKKGSRSDPIHVMSKFFTLYTVTAPIPFDREAGIVAKFVALHRGGWPVSHRWIPTKVCDEKLATLG